MIRKIFDNTSSRILFVTALLLLLTLIYTFPLVLNFFTHIPGYGNDINQYFWCHWWFGEALESGGQPWYTDHQWYPNGTSLVFSTNRFLSAGLGWLLSPLLGLIGSYNFVNILTFVVSGLGVYLFARELTNNEFGSIAAAIIFVFNPLKFNKLMHHHFLLATYAFGFVLWLLVRIIKNKEHKIRDAIIAGALYAWTFYDSPFLFVFLVLASILLVGWLAISQFRNFWKKDNLIALGLLFGVFLLAATPMLLLIWNDFPQYGKMPYALGAEIYSNDLVNIFSPSPLPFTPFGGKAINVFSPQNFTYSTHEENFAPVGWIVWPLAIAGWFTARKKSKYANLFLVAALFFLVLSLGPVLHILGNSQFSLPWDNQPSKIPLLYKHLDFLPLISLIRAPNRLMLVTFLFLGMLVAYAFSYLAKRFPQKATVISIVLLAVIVFDYFPHGVDLQEQFDVDETIKAIGNEKEKHGVLPIGLMYGENLRNGPVYDKPQTAGYTSRTTLFSRPLQDFSVIMVDRYANFAARHPEAASLPAYRYNVSTMLKAWDIGYIISKGDAERAQAIKRHLPVELLAETELYSSFKLLGMDKQPGNGIVYSAKDFPKMPEAGLNSTLHSSVFWTDPKGFVICVPDNLMQSGDISIECCSSLKSIPDQPVRIWFYCNRELLGSWVIKNKMQRYGFKLKPGHKRLPVNIIAFRTELLGGKEAANSSFPFRLNATSGNLAAGNTSSVTFEDVKLLEQDYRPATLHLTFLPANINKSPVLKSYSLDRYFAAAIDDDLRQNRSFPWVMLSTTGGVNPAISAEIIQLAEQLGLKLNLNKVRGKSFIALINREDSSGIYFSRASGNINLCINSDPQKGDPLVDIKGVYFH